MKKTIQIIGVMLLIWSLIFIYIGDKGMKNITGAPIMSQAEGVTVISSSYKGEIIELNPDLKLSSDNSLILKESILDVQGKTNLQWGESKLKSEGNFDIIQGKTSLTFQAKENGVINGQDIGKGSEITFTKEGKVKSLRLENTERFVVNDQPVLIREGSILSYDGDAEEFFLENVGVAEINGLGIIGEGVSLKFGSTDKGCKNLDNCIIFDPVTKESRAYCQNFCGFVLGSKQVPNQEKGDVFSFSLQNAGMQTHYDSETGKMVTHMMISKDCRDICVASHENGDHIISFVNDNGKITKSSLKLFQSKGSVPEDFFFNGEGGVLDLAADYPELDYKVFDPQYSLEFGNENDICARELSGPGQKLTALAVGLTSKPCGNGVQVGMGNSESIQNVGWWAKTQKIGTALAAGGDVKAVKEKYSLEDKKRESMLTPEVQGLFEAHFGKEESKTLYPKPAEVFGKSGTNIDHISIETFDYPEKDKLWVRKLQVFKYDLQGKDGYGDVRLDIATDNMPKQIIKKLEQKFGGFTDPQIKEGITKYMTTFVSPKGHKDSIGVVSSLDERSRQIVLSVYDYDKSGLFKKTSSFAIPFSATRKLDIFCRPDNQQCKESINKIILPGIVQAK